MGVISYRLTASLQTGMVTFRELNGHDELLVNDAGTYTAILLLDNILLASPQSAAAMAVTDRDRLLASVYQYTYGQRIESSLTCTSCNEPYDLAFTVADLLSFRNTDDKQQRDEHGYFLSDDGSRFRLPTGEDELAVFGQPAEYASTLILERCITQQVSNEAMLQVQAQMEALGPVLITDIATSCPECGTSQQAAFDMQSFLLTRLKNERKRVMVEVHGIALNYGWAHKEILDLPRTMRKTYAELIGLN